MERGEKKKCLQTGAEFYVQEHESQVIQKSSPILGDKEYSIPKPELHPDISHQRRYARRNEKTLYRTKCDLTGRSIITCINPTQGYKIREFHERHSDKLDVMEYGREYDLSKTFTEQFDNLLRDTPHQSLQLSPHMKNCDYCNYGYHASDCYMCSTAAFSERCYYSHLPLRCYLDVDGYENTDCQYTYQCVFAQNCYACQQCYYSSDCKNSYFLLDCRNCEECFGCVNLSHKKFCFFNQQLEKKEYRYRVEEFLKKYTREELAQKFYELSLDVPRRSTRGMGNDAVTGDLNFNMSNCLYCFDMQDAKEMSNSRSGGIRSSDFSRSSIVGMSTRIYECMGQAQSDSCAFCVGCSDSYQVFYSRETMQSENCFGCYGLRHKKYCILNKQYTKQEYEELVPKIIAQMEEDGERGRFLNPSMSPFPYNDSCAYDRFPESKEAITDRGWKRIDHQYTTSTEPGYQPRKTHEYKDSNILQKEAISTPIVCEITQRPYRIIQQELDFYVKFNIPLPKKHPDQRYKERFSNWVNPRKLFERKCAKTGAAIVTSYDSSRPEIVWSTEAWDKEYLG